jgi:hypothetical protein
MIKENGIRGTSKMLETRNAYILLENHEEERPLQRPRRDWGIILRDLENSVRLWIEVNRLRTWRDPVNKVMTPEVHFLTK